MRLDRLIAELGNRRANVQVRQESLDNAIRQFDERLDPTVIRPISAWKGKYGKRGALKALVIELLRLAGTEGIDTHSLAITVAAEFDLQITSSTELSRFQTNSIRNLLHKLSAGGIAESLHDPAATSNTNPGIWRLKNQAPTLSDLRAQRDAIAAGSH